jgi:hypothetical protein
MGGFARRGIKYHNLSELVFGLMLGVQRQIISVDFANKFMQAIISNDYSLLKGEDHDIVSNLIVSCTSLEKQWFTKNHTRTRGWEQRKEY